MEFLNYSYGTHLDETSDDPYHNVKFGMNHGKIRRNSGNPQYGNAIACFHS